MIPINHPTLPFPFNLEDRIKDHIKKLIKFVKDK